MNRLTERDEFGNADIIALSDIMPEIYTGLSFSETNALTDALNRLAAYEDTGLTPEEVKRLQRHGHWIEEEDIQICSECGEEHSCRIIEPRIAIIAARRWTGRTVTMIYIDRDKEQWDFRGTGADIITDTAFAVLMNAQAYAATSHKPLTECIDIVIDLVRKGLRDIPQDIAVEMRKEDKSGKDGDNNG